MSRAAMPSAPAPALQTLAEAALGLLARHGARQVDDGGRRWAGSFDGPGGEALHLAFEGPDLPATVPADIVPPDAVAHERPWTADYRLIVTAPLIVFDLAWNPGEKLRIMTFSRGAWEADLLALAG